LAKRSINCRITLAGYVASTGATPNVYKAVSENVKGRKSWQDVAYT
jgi:hypothetical protein